MDNIPTYISRKHGLEKVEDLHPLLTPLLAETYGFTAADITSPRMTMAVCE